MAMFATLQSEIQALTNSLKAQELALMSMRALREAQAQRVRHLARRNAVNAFTGNLGPL